MIINFLTEIQNQFLGSIHNLPRGGAMMILKGDDRGGGFQKMKGKNKEIIIAHPLYKL